MALRAVAEVAALPAARKELARRAGDPLVPHGRVAPTATGRVQAVLGARVAHARPAVPTRVAAVQVGRVPAGTKDRGRVIRALQGAEPTVRALAQVVPARVATPVAQTRVMAVSAAAVDQTEVAPAARAAKPPAGVLADMEMSTAVHPQAEPVVLAAGVRTGRAVMPAAEVRADTVPVTQMPALVRVGTRAADPDAAVLVDQALAAVARAAAALRVDPTAVAVELPSTEAAVVEHRRVEAIRDPVPRATTAVLPLPTATGPLADSPMRARAIDAAAAAEQVIVATGAMVGRAMVARATGPEDVPGALAIGGLGASGRRSVVQSREPTPSVGQRKCARLADLAARSELQRWSVKRLRRAKSSSGSMKGLCATRQPPPPSGPPSAVPMPMPKSLPRSLRKFRQASIRSGPSG